MVEFSLSNNAEKTFSDAYDPVTKLLFFLRSNYDYILKIVGLIENPPEKINKYETLINLFCHQFYDNILIPNPEQEELLILCFLLLEREIEGMNSASAASFLDKDSSFIGKFLTNYTNRQELRSYLSISMGDLILSINNASDHCFDLNPNKIYSYICKMKGTPQSGVNNKYDDDSAYYDMDFEILTKDIPRSNIKIDPHAALFNYNDEDEPALPVNNNNNTNSSVEYTMNYKPSSSSNDTTTTTNNNNIGENYELDINHDEINKRIQDETDQNLKDFFTRQLERITRDPNIFTNKKFKDSISEIKAHQMEVLIKYKQNFIFLKQKIDTIIQSLIDKITTIPYTLRCISKMIHLLISKKFSKISLYERNAFIGEFIFGKCILPILINSDMNAVITTEILSLSTRQCLKTIAKVLTKINRGYLFEANIDTDFTIFNHYIIEIIPLINSFYSKLIDVELPRVLDLLVKEYMNKPVEKISKRFKNQFKIRKDPISKSQPQSTVLNDVATATSNTNEVKKRVEYNYFNEHPEESVNLQCICFSIEDILQLISLIYPNINTFSKLPQFSFFQKTIDRIYNDEHKMAQKNDHGKGRCFFLIYREEINEKIVSKKETKKYILASESQDQEIIKERVKFCLKTILKGLNILNTKDYSYLNFATDSNKFFIALRHTLEDLDETSQNGASNKIPLKWYCQYLWNNKKMLADEFKRNDYEMLYDELYKEEQANLENLKTTSAVVMTRNGMNIRCAEKIIEKADRDLNKIKQIEMSIKMENFISQFKCPVCVVAEDLDKKKGKNIKTRDTTCNGVNNSKQRLTIIKAELCQHHILKHINEMSSGMVDSSSETNHPNSIKKFIKYIKKFSQLRQAILDTSVDYALYETFEKYLQIVKEGLVSNQYIKDDPEIEINNMKDRIDRYIMKSLYKDIFPSKQQANDKEFYEKTKMLKWIKPEHLEIKKLYVSELKYAIDCLKKMDEGQSVYEKLENLAGAHNTINNTLKFSSGSNADAGAEELSPILQYIIIKSQPKMFFSTIQYIKAFLHPGKTKGMYGFLLSQLEFSATFIMEVDYTKLKITKEEFERNCKGDNGD